MTTIAAPLCMKKIIMVIINSFISAKEASHSKFSNIIRVQYIDSWFLIMNSQLFCVRNISKNNHLGLSEYVNYQKTENKY